jgi:hypothetical protein
LSAPRSSACVFSFSLGFLLLLLHPAPPPCPRTPDRFYPPTPWTLARIPTHHVHIRVAGHRTLKRSEKNNSQSSV